jgi:hypothetical protein
VYCTPQTIVDGSTKPFIGNGRNSNACDILTVRDVEHLKEVRRRFDRVA